MRPGLTQQDVSNIFLVFSNLQDEKDAPDEVKLKQLQGLPFFMDNDMLDLQEMAKQNSEVVIPSESESNEPSSPRRVSNGISCCLGGCQGEDKHELDQNTMVEKNSRGIKKGSKGRRRRTHQTDTPWITFDQFFEVMSASMTRGDKDGSDGSNMLKEEKGKGSGI